MSSCFYWRSLWARGIVVPCAVCPLVHPRSIPPWLPLYSPQYLTDHFDIPLPLVRAWTLFISGVYFILFFSDSVALCNWCLRPDSLQPVIFHGSYSHLVQLLTSVEVCSLCSFQRHLSYDASSRRVTRLHRRHVRSREQNPWSRGCYSGVGFSGFHFREPNGGEVKMCFRAR